MTTYNGLTMNRTAINAQFAIAVISGLVCFLIAAWQIDVSRQIADRADDSAKQIATDQQSLDVQLDQLNQWRKRPNLEVIHERRVAMDPLQGRCEHNCTIQNTGGRDLVLFAIHSMPTTPLTELKGEDSPSIPGPVIAADRSKSELIDFTSADMRPLTIVAIDPPIIVTPGSSLTLRFRLRCDTPSAIFSVLSNNTESPSTLFQFRSPVAQQTH